ncbi:MAG: flavin-containing monooxygenase [Parvibaculaceae bacterium]
MTSDSRRVAVVGAGPAGLVGARFLKARGFEPILFERGWRVGGQWNHTAAMSGVWANMSANTSRIVSRFSDLDYPDDAAAFPHNKQVHAYLEAYAAQSGLLPAIRFATTVVEIDRASNGGYRLTITDGCGAEAIESFPRVVIASGRYNLPSVPDIQGLSSFAGAAGVSHASDYDGPVKFRDARVLIAGGSNSALEIACELARLGASSVAITMRRQRYVVPKLIAGVPVDNIGLTRFGALAAETFPPEATAAALKSFILAASGNPATYGAPQPAQNLFEARVALSQDYVPLLAEGRLTARPWITRIEGHTAWFEDGTAAEFDAVVMSTGYKLSLPFLSRDIGGILDIDDSHIDLADCTFHPDLDGLAVLGLYSLIGPYFPVLELQARYLAYAWSGAIAGPTRSQLMAGVAAYRTSRGRSQGRMMNAMAIRFARLAGVEPQPAETPQIARALMFGPLTATSFRSVGLDALDSAASAIASDAARYGAIPEPIFTDSERDRLAELADARQDRALLHLARR